jgi:uncharacterized membrane protein
VRDNRGKRGKSVLLSNALRMVLTVPKDALLKAEAKWKAKNSKKGRRPKSLADYFFVSGAMYLKHRAGILG